MEWIQAHERLSAQCASVGEDVRQAVLCMVTEVVLPHAPLETAREMIEHSTLLSPAARHHLLLQLTHTACIRTQSLTL